MRKLVLVLIAIFLAIVSFTAGWLLGVQDERIARCVEVQPLKGVIDSFKTETINLNFLDSPKGWQAIKAVKNATLESNSTLCWDEDTKRNCRSTKELGFIDDGKKIVWGNACIGGPNYFPSGHYWPYRAFLFRFWRQIRPE
jgi:hypothetical protein